MTLREIQALDAAYYLPVFGARTPVAFTHGEGATLYDTKGKAYTDFLGGIAVTALGHSYPPLVEALQAQAARLLHTSSLYYIEQQALLAQRLVENSVLDRAFFCSSGTEANEAAIKIARKFFYARGEDRYEIITAKASFHGRTLGALAATGQPRYQQPFAPMTPGFVHVPFNDIEALRAAVGRNSAAVMLETIQGEGGVIEGEPGYLQAVQALCRERGLLLLLDEVQTGMGRTGKLFSYQHFDLLPDLITLAKALGNGFPIGAVLCAQEVADSLEPGDHGSTFGGGPLACTAGLAVLDALLETDLLTRCAQTGVAFRARLEELAQRHPGKIRAVRGRGLLLGLALCEGVDAKAAMSACFKKGLLINGAGDNTLRFAPPFVISLEEIERLTGVLDQYFQAL